MGKKYLYLTILLFAFFCKEPVAKQFNHSRTFFPLTGAHHGVSCRECHKDGTLTSLPSDCQSCHPMTPMHTQNLGDCNLCHTTATFAVAYFNHSRAGIAIRGAHISLVVEECLNCHTTGTYTGISFTCSNCHSPPSIDGQVHTSATADCAQCHNQAFFSPAGFAAHSTYPTKLSGSHASLSCSNCHPSTFNNWANINFRDPAGIAYGSCARCHERDYDYGEEDHNGIAADANCGRCHGYSNFDD
jgi:hypothetical protein